ncbi:hypothetical protein FSS13T_20860 [Flavobacterium saliperosum S13]|uniref:Uncharacterized protein n=1 Tax=Flavobacterium saliperosum S13 TaxID=1341155 RepID=A0ABN0QEZ3_9FLAO|nr:hypothetical protein FSS13T_20860 [Flavobacterium saliperosum S13]
MQVAESSISLKQNCSLMSKCCSLNKTFLTFFKIKEILLDFFSIKFIFA